MQLFMSRFINNLCKYFLHICKFFGSTIDIVNSLNFCLFIFTIYYLLLQNKHFANLYKYIFK